MNIILHQPEIPANTGNIGRTCVATNTVLHLIEPLGFRLNEKEIKRVENLIVKLSKTNIKPGINLLIGADKLNETKQLYTRISKILNPSQIILVPQRYSNQPTPKDLSFVTNGKPFQAPSCILECKPPKDFVSISWDKKVNFCSYALEKQELKALNYQGLIESLTKVNWKSCC